MDNDYWQVEISGQAKKASKALSKTAVKAFALLLMELRLSGPYRTAWPNYGKLKNYADTFHCHVEKGRPTYVACWRIANKKEKILEVYYAGTHENAPY